MIVVFRYSTVTNTNVDLPIIEKKIAELVQNIRFCLPHHQMTNREPINKLARLIYINIFPEESKNPYGIGVTELMIRYSIKYSLQQLSLWDKIKLMFGIYYVKDTTDD